MLKKKLSMDGRKLLLGVDKDGHQYWLEKGKWDCGWYWSFGHIYYGGSFSHFDYLFGKDEKDRPVNLYDGFTKLLVESPLYEKGESDIDHKRVWELCDLMRSFYTLKDAADVLGHGGGNYTEKKLCKDVIQDEAYTKHLNDVVLPAIINKVQAMLTPEESAE